MDNKSAALEYSTMFPTIFRYIILGGLYVTMFMNFSKPSIQFILFMVMFILNFLTLVFVLKDMMGTPLLMQSIYGQLPANSDFNNGFTMIFIFIMLSTIGLLVASIAIILAVFAYGKKSTNDYTSYTMTPPNALLLSQFESSYYSYVVYLAMFVYFVIFAHTTGPTRNLMFNIACLFFSIVIVFTSVFCCLASVHLLKIKQYKKQLYV